MSLASGISRVLVSQAVGPQTARKSLANAIYGVLDYLVYPLAMLLAAPVLLHRLGASQYGLWMLVIAVITGASLAGVGLGDATLRYVAMYRGPADWTGAARVLRSALTLNLILGSATAVLLSCAAPYVVHHVGAVDPHSQATGIWILRVGSAILVVRSVECVLANTLRAFERYGPALVVNGSSRAATVLAAILLTSRGYGVDAIMNATLIITCASVVMLVCFVKASVPSISFVSSPGRSSFAELLGFGSFVWLQAVAGIIFSQADRLMIGATLGTSAVAYYVICIQGTQPIHGLLAAGLHFLFPRLSFLSVNSGSLAPNVIRPLMVANVFIVVLMCLPLALIARPILSLWMGVQFAEHAWPIFSIAAVGFGLLGLNVTAHYALLALGQVRFVSVVNVLAGVATLIAMAILIPRYGLLGAALGRLIYGPVTWLMYYRLYAVVSQHGTLESESVDSLAIQGSLQP